MSKLKAYMDGEVIAKEGEKAKNFFILVEGTVGIFKGENKLAEYSQEGTILGEISLILKKPRSATIKALSKVNLLVIEGELDEIIKRFPDYSKKLIKTLAERLAKANEEYWHH